MRPQPACVQLLLAVALREDMETCPPGPGQLRPRGGAQGREGPLLAAANPASLIPVARRAAVPEAAASNPGGEVLYVHRSPRSKLGLPYSQISSKLS
jgi:hypothetical protein